MKRILYILFIIFAFASAAYSVEEKSDVAPITLDDLQSDTYFRSPTSLVMPGINDQDIDYTLYSPYMKGAQGPSNIEGTIPVFMRTRLQLQQKWENRGAQKEIEADENADNEDGKFSKKFQKLKFWEKDEIDEEDVVEANPEPSVLEEEGLLESSIKDETKLSEEDAIALESGIVEQVSDKELMLDSDQVNYDEKTGNMIAHGRPILTLPRQDMKIVSDEMSYNPDSNILKAYGNVCIYRKGVPTKTDFVEVDINEETVVMDNISMLSDVTILDAERAMQKDSLLILENGNVHSDVSEIHRLSSRMLGPAFWTLQVPVEEQALFFGDPTGNKLHIDLDYLYIDAKKQHNKYIAKGIKVYRDGKLGLKWPKMIAYTNKEGSTFEANYPELGSKRGIGLYAGPGFVFGGPGGSVIKAIPIINYKDGFGIGGLVKYRNKFNSTYFGYGSANDMFILKGRQRLDNNLFLQYASNMYNDEWFLGGRMAKYAAELYYDKQYYLPDFLTEKRDLTFRHRFGVGIMEDPDRNYHGESFGGSGMSTTRFRYMAEIAQSLYSYRNVDKRLYMNFSAVMQGSAAVYGTGGTQFIGRIGPRFHVQYKNWAQDLEYFCTAYDDQTPMMRYDSYRYGASSVRLSEVYRVNKYLSVGWSGLATLSDDSPNDKLFQENRFAVAIGPDDFRIRFGYDFVRETSFMGFDIAFDTKGTSITYKKMEIKNPERLGKSKDERELAFVAPEKTPIENEKNVNLFGKKQKPKANVLEYATVIDIEDPDKEQID